VQEVAKVALKGNEEDFKDAREKLSSVQRLLSKVSKSSNVQSEEYSNFVSQSKALESQLKMAQNKKGKDDATAKVLYQMKGAKKNEFLSGARKKIQNRTNCDDGLTEMYYDYKMSKDKNLVKE